MENHQRLSRRTQKPAWGLSWSWIRYANRVFPKYRVAVVLAVSRANNNRILGPGVLSRFYPRNSPDLRFCVCREFDKYWARTRLSRLQCLNTIVQCKHTSRAATRQRRNTWKWKRGSPLELFPFPSWVDKIGNSGDATFVDGQKHGQFNLGRIEFIYSTKSSIGRQNDIKEISTWKFYCAKNSRKIGFRQLSCPL